MHKVGQEARSRLLSRKLDASVSSALPGGIWSAATAQQLAHDAHMRETREKHQSGNTQLS